MALTTPPAIETERLILRDHRAADLDDYAAMWGDPDVHRFLGAKPNSREESWTRLLRAIGHWRLLGYGLWIVQERASGRLVGEIGFGDFQRTLETPFGDAPECGWTLAPWSHGRGYATEAMAGAAAWGDQLFTAPRTVCLIHPENTASLRVAAKCGYRPYDQVTYRDQPAILLERPSPSRPPREG